MAVRGLPHRILRLFCVAFLAGSAEYTFAAGFGTHAEDIDYTCTQNGIDVLDCAFRLRGTATVKSISASIDNFRLPPAVISSYPGQGENTAIVFVIDTGSTLPADSFSIMIQRIRHYIENARPHQHLGLATFDGSPAMTTPLTAAPQQTLEALNQFGTQNAGLIRHRDLSAAIQRLATFNASRKGIFFFSDGGSEPAAYHSAKLVDSARSAGIVIYAISHSPAKVLSVGQETLRRLSSETGGRLLFATGNGPLRTPDGAEVDPLIELESGGLMSFELTPALQANQFGTKEIAINLVLAQKAVELRVPVTLTPPDADRALDASVVTSIAEENLAATLPVRRTAPQYSLWIWAIILALSLTLAVLVLLLYRSRSRVAREHVLSQIHFATAALIRADEPQARYVIANTPWRIGRDPDNELVINDNSVSRHHAEIIHGRANSFLIRDLDSLNGVFVNDKRVQIATLTENDEVDVGDIRFRFQLQSGVLETRAESR